MNLPKELNLKEQFNLYINLILNTWTIPDIETFNVAAKDLFNKGLADARLWTEDYISYAIGSAIKPNKLTSVVDLLKDRKNLYFDNNAPAILYDCLCVFDNALDSSLSKLYKAQTRFGKWNYSEKTTNIINYVLKNYPSLNNVKPIELSTKDQNKLMKEYTGFKAEGLAFSDLTHRISYDYAKYSNDDQDRNYFYTLFSAIYTFGLACMKEKNTRSLVAHFAPLYSKLNALPLNMHNDNEIMEVARQHELMPLLEEIYEFKFYIPEYSKPNKILTKEEEDKEIENYISELLKSLQIKEESLNIKKEEEQLDLLIEDFKQKLPVISI